MKIRNMADQKGLGPANVAFLGGVDQNGKGGLNMEIRKHVDQNAVGPATVENGPAADQSRTEGPVAAVSPRADQRIARALALLEAEPERFTRQGAVLASYRIYRGRKLGPYFRLAWREGDRQRSVYLGRAGEGVERVRAALAQMQRPRVERQTLASLERQARQGLRACKRELAELLAPLGVQMRGWQIRGLRALAELTEGFAMPDAPEWAMAAAGP